MPVGTSLTIVADESVDARVRPGAEFRAHLRDPLELSRTLVAVAGTRARIVVVTKEKDGSRYRIAIVGLNLGVAGTLPVKPVTPVVDRIAAGMPFAATTLAAVAFEEGRVRVAVPLPFTLSNETPAAAFTPAPLRTANPALGGRRPRSRPSASPTPAEPTGSPAASPTATPSSAPLFSPAPTPQSTSPTPAATSSAS